MDLLNKKLTSAETLEVVRGVLLPVARTGHLIALKLLSVAPGRETDAADLRNLAAVANEDEWNLARANAKILSIFEVTSEIQQLVIARAISGLRIE
jgi:alkylation response protein AidB-like acyl-CoA dehydrogenase